MASGDRLSSALLGLWFAAVVLFLFFPLFVVVLFSFNTGEISVLPIQGFTLAWYAKLFDNQSIANSLYNSLFVAGFTVVVSVVLGVSFAIGIARRGGRLSIGLLGFAAAPMVLPRLILGVALLTFVSAVGVRLSLVTVMLGHSLIGIPYVVLIVHARLANFDYRLEEAAWDLGAGFFHVLWTITLPLIAPAIIAAALIVFTLSFDDVVVAVFLTGVDNTLPMLLWGLLRYGITPEVNALASITLLVSGITAVFAEVMLRLSVQTHESNRLKKDEKL
jgi:spermidine/putrescine transport system permease protein